MNTVCKDRPDSGELGASGLRGNTSFPRTDRHEGLLGDRAPFWAHDMVAFLSW
ncbi:hypothetical protein ACFU8W_03175 [Streptomyces sp. NPDC057565]|uniref:hypothetical protein n=1 Tax=Streptomyces sp. NPDC057565 TaxID=3346169 RepID=UPI003692B705